ncbi:response regulator [bacterium]|nr:response regulator [bacterium]
MSEKKILIVDYDKKSLDKMASLFDSYDFQILKAADGQEAYEKYKSEKPDLILLEAMLPKYHGFDLTQKISTETKGSLPIVIVTGLYKGPQYRNEALRSFGASDYFEKPFDEKKLIQSIMNLLQDETDIEEELPQPEDVKKILRQMGPEASSSKKNKSS